MPALVQVQPVALLPTPAGCAVFLGDGEKVIVFYIENAIGASIDSAISQNSPPRPLSHDLMKSMLDGFGARMTRATIVAFEEEVFYARLFLEIENELTERKIVELDARPSDCIALAIRSQAPLYVVGALWERLDDMSEILNELQNQDNDDES